MCVLYGSSFNVSGKFIQSILLSFFLDESPFSCSISISPVCKDSDVSGAQIGWLVHRLVHKVVKVFDAQTKNKKPVVWCCFFGAVNEPKLVKLELS